MRIAEAAESDYPLLADEFLASAEDVADDFKPKLGKGTCVVSYRGVYIRWTGLLDWTTGLDYWTAIIYSKWRF